MVGTALNERRRVNGLIFLSGGGGELRECVDLQRQQAFRELKDAKSL